MYKSGFAYKASINQNAYGWSTSGNACFYIDENDFCRSNSLKQFRNEHSYGISSSTSGSAYIQKTINVTQNTNYVINVMVKSTFTNRNTLSSGEPSLVSSIPAYIDVSASGVSEHSIELVGVSDEWTEMSVGFNSGSNTSVTVKIGVDFPTNISGLESVLFSDIRLDKITPTKVLLLAYPKVEISELGYSQSYSTNTLNVFGNKLNTMASQFTNLMKRVSNKKVIPQVTTRMSSLNLTHVNVDTTAKRVSISLKGVADNNSSTSGDYIDFSQYDCVICNIPLSSAFTPSGTTDEYKVFYGLFYGLFSSPSDEEADNDYKPIDEKIGFIHLTRDFLENFNPTGTKELLKFKLNIWKKYKVRIIRIIIGITAVLL
ncbi:MAG: hypothetical protein V3G42_14440 [Oscillospiraceae bacterium]